MAAIIYDGLEFDYSDQPWLSRNAKKYCSIRGAAIFSRHLDSALVRMRCECRAAGRTQCN